MESIFERVVRVVIEKTEIAREEVGPDSHFERDLLMDSLDLVELMLALEEEFRQSIPEEKAQGFQTVGQIVRFIEGQQSTTVS